MYSIDEILNVLASEIHQEAFEYAISKMSDVDFIQIADAYDKLPENLDNIEGPKIIRNCQGFVLKRSCIGLFNKHYDEKFLEVLKRILDKPHPAL